jgi:transcriptional regulator with XRE-family HTH domain
MLKSLYNRHNHVFLEMLRTSREARRLRQRDVGRMLGRGQGTVSKVEAGVRRLDVIELRAWLGALGVDFVDFIGELDQRLREFKQGPRARPAEARPPPLEAVIPRPCRNPAMFVSRPSYCIPLPPELTDPGERHWKVLEVFSRLPWFLTTVRSGEGDESFEMTFCFCWETDIIDMIAANLHTKVTSLQMLQPLATDKPGWSIRSIAKIATLGQAGELRCSCRFHR